MRLLICAGGTGGGVNPALAVLQALGSEAETVLWVGSEGGMEADLVKRSAVPYEAIPAAGVHGVGVRSLPGNLLKLARGTAASRRILRRFQPDVLLFTGGYVAVPMALAGRSVPTLLYVPDIEPGLALKALARFADRIAVTAEASRAYFAPGKNITVTGYPTRPGLGSWERGEARRALNLSDNLPVLLVSGGSKGAQGINRVVFAHLPELLQTAQVVHLTGQLDAGAAQTALANLPAELAGRYHPHAYLHDEMGAALSAADLAVTRAGASTLGELPLYGLPAVLVPYPYAWRYQKVNAGYLQARGAAVLVEESQLGERLVSEASAILGQPERLSAMRAAARALATPEAASRIAALAKELAGSRGAKSW